MLPVIAQSHFDRGINRVAVDRNPLGAGHAQYLLDHFPG